MGRSGTLSIAIATSGRFHVLDLARELAAFGHDVRLYSMLPHRRSEAFGLAGRCHRSLLPFVAPLAVWQRYAPRALPSLHEKLFSRALDRAVEAVLEPCDVLICMSGIFVRAIAAAKRRYGARIWLERGSQHILSQTEILASLPNVRVPSADVIGRELEGYRRSDRIVVPARHVAASFERDPAAQAKLFLNPYGTNLDMFPYAGRVRDAASQLRLVFAGAWSMRKGCDILTQAVQRCDDIRLEHFGARADCAFPETDGRFRHHGAVPQRELAKHYGEADCFVLASREEGLSVVQAQALATGLPVICTDRTGGEDLGHTPALRDRIIVVPHDNVEALRNAIEGVRMRLRNGPPFAPLTPQDLETLSWTAYARRYEAELLKDLAAHRNPSL